MEVQTDPIEQETSPIQLDSEKIKETIIATVKSELEDWMNKTLTISCISEEIERRYKINKNDIYECSKEIKRLERELNLTKEQNRMNFTEICKMQLLFEDILTDLRLKAYQGDLERANREISEKCSIKTAEEIQNTLKTLTTNTQFKALQQALDEFKDKVVKEYEPKKEIFNTFERLEKKMLSLMSGFISRDELRLNSNNLTIRIAGIHEETLKIKRDEKSFEENLMKEVSKIRTDFSDCARQFQLERLKKEIDKKTSKVEFDEFITENLPKISEYSLEFKKVNNFIEQQEKAILRIDEIICEKASKLDLRFLRESFNDFPAKQQGEAIQKLLASFKSIDLKIEHIGKQVNELYDILEESGASKAGYETRMGLIKSELQDLENRVTYKADRNEVLEYLERKASWEDFTHLSESIETVHMQNKILAAQISYLLPPGQTKKVQSQKKITKKLVDIVISSRPTIDDSPSAQLKNFIKFPQTPDLLKSRSCTPHRRFTNNCTSLPT